jgi:hypothetical protein
MYMIKKTTYLLIAAGLLVCGCGGPQIPQGSGKPTVIKTSSGGAVLPGGVPLPADAVKAGATKGYNSK